MVTETKNPAVVDLLEKLGFKAASTMLKEQVKRKRKMALAYEHYKFIRPEKINAFNARLYEKTYNRKTGAYQTLAFQGIEYYEGAPPASVLESLEVAQERKCFDAFEVAHIRNVEDPLLLGLINGCTDKFFIDQWDNDVKITDILKENEG